MEYKSKFYRSYFWQTLGILTQIASIFIVLPLLGESKNLFAVYVFLNSTVVVMNYLDFGFYSSSLKYAAEAFSLNRSDREQSIFQVSFFILFVVAGLVLLLFMIVIAKPHTMFSNTLLDSLSSLDLSRLILIHCAGIIIFPIQRLIQGYFTIRIELFKLQKVNVASSIAKILLAPLLFAWGYGLIEYYLLTKVIDCLTLLILFILYHELSVLFSAILKYSEINLSVLIDLSPLARHSFLGSLAWLLFYELDMFVVTKFGSSSEIVLFSTAFALIQYLRFFTSAIFSVFQNRFNHIKVANQGVTLKSYYLNLVSTLWPIYIYGMVIVNALALQLYILLYDDTDGLEYFRLFLIVFCAQPIFMFWSYLKVATLSYKDLRIYYIGMLLFGLGSIVLFIMNNNIESLVTIKVAFVSLFFIYIWKYDRDVDLNKEIMISVKALIALGLFLFFSIFYFQSQKMVTLVITVNCTVLLLVYGRRAKSIINRVFI